jgi:hypothetical protein
MPSSLNRVPTAILLDPTRSAMAGRAGCAIMRFDVVDFVLGLQLMRTRAALLLAFAGLVSSASGFALSAHLHEAGHATGGHDRERCPVCFAVLSAASSIAPEAPTTASVADDPTARRAPVESVIVVGSPHRRSVSARGPPPA